MKCLTIFAIVSKSSIAFKPVVIIPGTGGSQLEAKLDKPSVNHFYCSRTSDWYTLWLSLPQLFPPAINCWVDNIMLLWDPVTRVYSNNLGVSTRNYNLPSVFTVDFEEFFYNTTTGKPLPYPPNKGKWTYDWERKVY